MSNSDFHPEIAASEDLPISPEVAFDLFTKHINDWYAITPYSVKDSDNTVGVLIEEGVGGRFIEIPREKSKEGNVLGEITLWEPPSRFTFVDLAQCKVAIEFSPIAAGCRITISTHVPETCEFQRLELLKKYGWHTVLKQYCALVMANRKEGA